MHRVKIIPLLFLLILQACLPPTPIEETAIINARGVDLIEEEGKRMIETTIVPFLFDPNAPDITNILVSRGSTIKEAREEASKKSSYLLTPGKISIELYGKEAAEAGIIQFLNTLIRDARVSDRMQLAITNKKAREILELEQEKITINTTEYMQDLINKEIEQDILPRNTLEYYTRLTEQVGIDPLLPIIDEKDEWPTLVGAALMRGDKYVGSISLEQAFLINQFRRKVSNTPLSATVPQENYQEEISQKYKPENSDDESLHVSLRLNKGRTKLKIIDIETLKFKAEVKMSAELLETSILTDIKTKEVTKRMEKDLAAFFKSEYEKLFEKLKEVNSDAFGLGRKYNTTRKGSDITEEEWEKLFPDVSLEFEVDFTLINFGTID